MSVLVRSWNLFHGYTVPFSGAPRLEEAVRLAASGGPDVLCLQEVPAWALPRLAAWTGMTAVPVLARPASLGPLPLPASAARAATAALPRLRSFLAGQGNAVLVRRGIPVSPLGVLTLNDAAFRRRVARALGLAPVARLAWAHERRVCQAVRLELPDGPLVLANLHATAYPADRRLADAEVLRAGAWVSRLAGDGAAVLAGDCNARGGRSQALRDLARPPWGFDGAGPGIDHVLVRAAAAEPATTWPPERRRAGGVLLSDHAPVERRVG